MTALWESYSSTLHDDALTQPSDALQGGSSSFSEEQDEEFGVDDDALIAATQAVEAQQAAATAAAAADPDNGGGDDGADDDSMDALFASLPDSMVSGAPAAADAQAAPPQKPGALVEPTSAPVSPVSPVKDGPAPDAAPDSADSKPEAEEKPAAEEDEERRGEGEADEAPDAVSAELSFSPPAAVPVVGSQGSRYSRSPSPCFDDDDDDDESMDGMATQAWAGDEGAAVGGAEPAEEQATAAPDADMAADDSSDEAVPDAEPEDAAAPAAAPEPSVAESPKVEVVEEPLAPKVTKIELVFVPTEGRDAGKLAVKWNTKEPFIEMTLALGAPDPQRTRC